MNGPPRGWASRPPKSQLFVDLTSDDDEKTVKTVKTLVIISDSDDEPRARPSPASARPSEPQNKHFRRPLPSEPPHGSTPSGTKTARKTVPSMEHSRKSSKSGSVGSPRITSGFESSRAKQSKDGQRSRPPSTLKSPTTGHTNRSEIEDSAFHSRHNPASQTQKAKATNAAVIIREVSNGEFSRNDVPSAIPTISNKVSKDKLDTSHQSISQSPKRDNFKPSAPSMGRVPSYWVPNGISNPGASNYGSSTSCKVSNSASMEGKLIKEPKASPAAIQSLEQPTQKETPISSRVSLEVEESPHSTHNNLDLNAKDIDITQTIPHTVLERENDAPTITQKGSWGGRRRGPEWEAAKRAKSQVRSVLGDKRSDNASGRKIPSDEEERRKEEFRQRKLLRDSKGLPRFEDPYSSEDEAAAAFRRKQFLRYSRGLPNSPEDEAAAEKETVDDEDKDRSDGNATEKDGIQNTRKSSSAVGDKERVSRSSSINSSSPLVNRLREKKQRGMQGWRLKVISRNASPISEISPPMPRHGLSVGEIEKQLKIFEISMDEDHSADARAFISINTRIAHATEETKFDDDVNPFASMKDISTPEKQLGSIRVDTYNAMSTKKTSSKKSVWGRVQTIEDDNVERVPKYNYHINLKRNHLTADVVNLGFIPLMGSEYTEKEKKAYEDKLDANYAGRKADSRPSERFSRLREYLGIWLKQLDLSCDESMLIRYLLEKKTDESFYRTRDKKTVIEVLGGPLSAQSIAIATDFTKAFDEHFDVSLEEVLLSKTRFKELLKSTKNERLVSPRSVANSSADRLGTITDFECLICHTMCCPTHGEYTHDRIHGNYTDVDSDSTEKFHYETIEDDYECTWHRLVMPYNDTLRKHLVGQRGKEREWDLDNIDPTNPDDNSPCDDMCFLLGEHEGSSDPDWSPEEITELHDSLLTWKPTTSLPCALAVFFQKPCWEVYRMILKRPPRKELIIPRTKSRPAEWYDPKSKTLRYDFEDSTDAHDHMQRSQANPCNHEGPCRDECICVQHNVLCETFCSCPDDCARRFTGCSCHSRGLACVSDTCICVRMNRECGPLCTSCGAIPRIDPLRRHEDELFVHGCQNIVLQRGVFKKLIIGESLLAGLGLFVGEPVKKGDFLSEYVGEVISSDEADRRGTVYDAKFISYLFDINADWVVDAARFGNKTRFINHADNEKNGLNCVPKILWVNGEHRIKFTALRDIAVGEELLFDYGKSFADKHGLNKKLEGSKNKDKTMPKTKTDGKRKGAVEGQRASTGKLRGIRRVRQKVTEMEDAESLDRRPRGKGSRKARKTANMQKDINAEDSSEGEVDGEVDGNGEDNEDSQILDFMEGIIAQDSDENDETFRPKGDDVDVLMRDADESGEEGVRRRTGRARKVPARYTR